MLETSVPSQETLENTKYSGSGDNLGEFVKGDTKDKIHFHGHGHARYIVINLHLASPSANHCITVA